MKNLEYVKKLKGDASFRKFFRKKNKKKTSIIVYAKKEKKKNLLIYDSINKVLKKNNILAPKLYEENYKKDYIVIQDFGDETIYEIFNKYSSNKFQYFRKIIKLLTKIQSIKDKNIKNFKKKNYVIPKYKKKILFEESQLFCDWYTKSLLTKKNQDRFKKKFTVTVNKLISNLKLKNNTFVHRDFHISNLMKVKNQIGVIDSQDAVIGNKAYDLASLIDDVRFKTSKTLKRKIYMLYIKDQKKLDERKFKNDFEILSILRNLKIIGIFTRLAVRDGKKKYLKLIPYAWNLINLRIKNNIIFKDLKNLLNENFKKKLNEN
tara:strand:+ start:484 stop:1440 length:957 start_codon:yes stop_codon:yes gene_type:complete